MALDLVDFFMDEGKMPLFSQVSSKDFLSTLVNILKNRGASVIQEKILYLLKKWGVKFEKHRDIIPNFTDIYDQLKKNNTFFPNVSTPPYYKYLFSEDELNKKFDLNNANLNNSMNNKLKNNGNDFKNNSVAYPSLSQKNSIDNEVAGSAEAKIVDYSYGNYIDLSPEKFSNKYRKFVSELIVWMDNITLANVIF